MTAGSELRGDRVVLAPVADVHVPELRRILGTPEVRLRWGEEAASALWPFDDPSAIRFAVFLDGTVCGMVQYGEEEDPAYRHASIDIFLDPVVHGRGVGRDAVGTLARHLVQDRGHHRLVIDPAADNEAAIRCYTAVGFRPVGVLRRYERDADGAGWHDGLLMDLLAEELEHRDQVSNSLRTETVLGRSYGTHMTTDVKIDWAYECVEQLDLHWRTHLRPRFDGLTDAEYLWEPVPGCWSIRPRGEAVSAMAAGAGDWVADFEMPEPDPAPVTTIAWRLGHMSIGLFAMRASSHFGDGSVSYQTTDWPSTAAGALDLLDRSYEAWISGVRALDHDGLARAVGPAEGPWADYPMATLILHINREAIHHGAEVALLRDLYRASFTPASRTV